MNKTVAWILLILGVYEILALLISTLPAYLEGTWGWVIGIVLIVLGGWMLKKQ
jgi:hypothetical protein|tara:strand:- start:519 stop:677 length:159 start_codon:yes stop_codon:yes gene_type:complete